MLALIGERSSSLKAALRASFRGKSNFLEILALAKNGCRIFGTFLRLGER